MDFQKVVDGFTTMACVVSVENFGDGKYGKFRLVAGNKAYVDSIEHPAPGTEMLKDKFTPNSEYTDYLTRDLNFEDYCYRSAVGKSCLHSYAHPDRIPVWFNMFFLPLDAEEGNLCYCIYIMEINFKAESDKMASISSETSAAVLDTCIKIRGAEDFREAMREVIKDIRDMCECEHGCILTVDEYERKCGVLCEALSKDTKLLPMDTYVDDAFYAIAESWEGTIAGSNCLVVKNEQDMEVVKERNPEWYESLTSAGGKTIVLFPLKSNNQLLGYIWAINFPPELAPKIKETLEISTFILGSELGTHILLERLKVLSSKDMLTGVMNRNEMNNFVDRLTKGEEETETSVGVIFADLNGLKTVNDQEGHAAGDILLKNAANAIREVFDEHSIFRAGGDEFSIIVTGLTKEKLADKIQAIRDASEHYNKVSFAIGGSTEDDYRNVRSALRHADEAMYIDKEKYYKEHPDKRR